jgi:hypothetical protein
MGLKRKKEKAPTTQIRKSDRNHTNTVGSAFRNRVGIGFGVGMGVAWRVAHHSQKAGKKRGWYIPGKGDTLRGVVWRYRLQNAVNCSTLRERTAGSPPNTSQVSVQACLGQLLIWPTGMHDKKLTAL